MVLEGCDVKLFIESDQQRNNFDGLVPKTNNWEQELTWVGKNGLIVFDDVGYGAKQTELRALGYSVVGGSTLGDKLEINRQWSKEVMQAYGVTTLPTFDFSSIDAAITFLNQEYGPWVIKQNGHASKSINFVGHFEDNRDTLSVLLNYQNLYGNEMSGCITLQKKVSGVEIGIGRFFNGKDWVGPIELNVEHKRMFPGDLGPATGEMGTIAWYEDDENQPLFQQTIAKMRPFLQKIDFRGDFDIGCIVNEYGVYALEATSRFGSPIDHLHSELHHSPWSELLKAIADGQPYHLQWKRGMGIVISVAVPPFPYTTKLNEMSSYDIDIFFDDTLTSEDMKHIHFEEVSIREKSGGGIQHFISDHRGYVLYVTAVEDNIFLARDSAHDLLRRIHIPKMFYRNDIGLKFASVELPLLRKWGYLCTPIPQSEMHFSATNKDRCQSQTYAMQFENIEKYAA